MNDDSPYNQNYFAKLYAHNDDPWQYESRWYEARKRAITLALLPKQHYKSALEIGCSNGVLSQALASRCGQLCCIDGSAQAVALAKRRLANSPQVTVRQAVIPQDLSTLTKPPFDLIVASEVLYYLSAADLAQVANWLVHALAADGTLLVCHWRYAIDGFDLTGDAVHKFLQTTLPLYQLSRLQEADFLLDVWQQSPISVAQREGLIDE